MTPERKKGLIRAREHIVSAANLVNLALNTVDSAEQERILGYLDTDASALTILSDASWEEPE